MHLLIPETRDDFVMDGEEYMRMSMEDIKSFRILRQKNAIKVNTES